MLNKSIIALAIGLLAATSMTTGAMAGGKGKGYDPLFWNGPAGTDHNVLFTKTGKYGGYTVKHYVGKSCYRYKKNYINTGKKYWLRKYEVCKIDLY